ncbi:MAG TPA: LysM domain-containing protein [Thermoleophilaceae bacterium]|nr:LysM domain-containing protein [Thermoleophilaceae bacterium]
MVVAAIVLGSGVVGGDDDGSTGARTSDLPTATERTTTAGRKQTRRATYTIKTDDTLSGIAAETGTTVERLQELNPELDAEALVAGQKIKLRE